MLQVSVQRCALRTELPGRVAVPPGIRAARDALVPEDLPQVVQHGLLSRPNEGLLLGFLSGLL